MYIARVEVVQTELRVPIPEADLPRAAVGRGDRRVVVAEAEAARALFWKQNMSVGWPSPLARADADGPTPDQPRHRQQTSGTVEQSM